MSLFTCPNCNHTLVVVTPTQLREELAAPVGGFGAEAWQYYGLGDLHHRYCVMRALRKAGWTSVGGLAYISDEDLLKQSGLGKVTLRFIREHFTVPVAIR